MYWVCQKTESFERKSLLEVNFNMLPESAVVKEEKHMLG